MNKITQQQKFAPPMTIEERGTIEKFKDYLDLKEVEYDEDKYDNKFLIRFLRARKLDLEKAYIMFTDYLKWRETENVEKISVININ